MVDIYVDTETAGLNTANFVAGCIRRDNITEIYYTKDELWCRILELGNAVKRRRDVLNVYCFNTAYDFLVFADLKDKNIKIFSDDNPFIASYGQDRQYIKFLDVYAIFPMSLKALGEEIGIKKGELSDEFKESLDKISDIKKLKDMIKNNVNNMKDYLELDTLIPLKAMQMLKKKLSDEGVHLKRLVTISQISIGYIINKLAEDDRLTKDNFWYHKLTRKIRRPKFSDDIHCAYRGPKVECFQPGIHAENKESYKIPLSKGVYHYDKNVDYYDVNSLYPYSIMNIDVPMLGSDRKIKEPLTRFTRSYILSKIGVSRVLLENVSDDYGLIPVRTPNGNYYPEKGKYIIGTYTHDELNACLKDYRIIDIEWSILYDRLNYNPFNKIYKRLFELKQSGSGFDRLFYKQIMNSSIGRMAMKRPMREFVIDSVDNAEAYLERNYEIIQGKGRKYLFEKKYDTYDVKTYYMPMIPCLVNAYARIKMWKDISRFDKDDIIYTDTDSIILRSRTDIKGKIIIGDNIGEYKKVHENKEGIFYGKKTYLVGDDIKISGMRKKGIKPEDFVNGYVNSVKMVKLRSATEDKPAGSFYNEGRDLFVQYYENMESGEKMRNEKLYMDEDIDDIQYFHKKIKSLK